MAKIGAMARLRKRRNGAQSSAGLPDVLGLPWLGGTYGPG